MSHGVWIDVLVDIVGEPRGADGEKDQIASADVADSLRRTRRHHDDVARGSGSGLTIQHLGHEVRGQVSQSNIWAVRGQVSC
jgi:hypothetical protein